MKGRQSSSPDRISERAPNKKAVLDENIGVRELVGHGPLGKKDPDKTPVPCLGLVAPAKIDMTEIRRPIIVTRPLGGNRTWWGQAWSSPVHCALSVVSNEGPGSGEKP